MCEAVTQLSDDALLPGSARTPKAMAMGDMPLPIFDKVREMNGMDADVAKAEEAGKD